jgi:hypothetical protein
LGVLCVDINIRLKVLKYYIVCFFSLVSFY